MFKDKSIRVIGAGSAVQQPIDLTPRLDELGLRRQAKDAEKRKRIALGASITEHFGIPIPEPEGNLVDQIGIYVSANITPADPEETCVEVIAPAAIKFPVQLVNILMSPCPVQTLYFFNYITQGGDQVLVMIGGKEDGTETKATFVENSKDRSYRFDGTIEQGHIIWNHLYSTTLVDIASRISSGEISPSIDILSCHVLTAS